MVLERTWLVVGSASFTVSGKVDPKGAVTVTVARGSQSATGTGVMSGTDGTNDDWNNVNTFNLNYQNY